MSSAADQPGASTVAELIERRAGDEHVGLMAGDRRWTWREVVDTSRCYATALRRVAERGASAPHAPLHVGVLMDNTPEHLFVLFGTALAGGVTVGLNTTRRGGELARDVVHTDCSLVLTDSKYAPLLDGLDLGGTPVWLVDDATWLEELDASVATDGTESAPEPSDTFMLIFTSGSTAAPKAVVMSHGRAAGAANDSTWFGADDVLYCAMPLFHGNAINAIVLPALSTGAAIALRERFSASEFMPDVRYYGATFFTSVGRALGYILATPPDELNQVHSVKYALAPESSRADVKEFRRRFGITCVTGYGSSENAVIMVPARGLAPDPLGRPKEGIEAAIVDRETGAFCPPATFDKHGKLTNAGEAIGEIVGLNVSSRFEGYYNNPEAEAARNRNGWYWTGDLGYQDSEGVFYFAGRLDDWLRVDSENFATAPVERILVRYPPAAAVAVYAVPDERTADDQVMAAIELAPGDEFDPDDFTRFVSEQPDLSAKWVPRYLRITKIPVGATNKIDRRTLRSERWYTNDPMFWRPSRESRYGPFTAEDLRELEARFATHGRSLDRP